MSTAGIAKAKKQTEGSIIGVAVFCLMNIKTFEGYLYLAFPSSTKAIPWMKLLATTSISSLLFFLLLLLNPGGICGRRNGMNTQNKKGAGEGGGLTGNKRDGKIILE